MFSYCKHIAHQHRSTEILARHATLTADPLLLTEFDYHTNLVVQCATSVGPRSPLYYDPTRNSAVADKPREASVQIQWRG